VTLRLRIAAASGAALMAASVAACAGGSLSDEAYAYCVNEAPPAELDAAAEARNTAPDADQQFETNPNRGDPTFQRVCEYAYDARDRDVDAGAGAGQPMDESQSAPLDPQRSQDAGSFAPPAPVSPPAS
jgi:hypothetical protein